MQLGSKLKELRAKQGWSQEDLAREVGVSLSTVQRWESKGAKPYRLALRELERLYRKAGIEVQ
jgi:transcriptional regulator with XRE-family HTH domain